MKKYKYNEPVSGLYLLVSCKRSVTSHKEMKPGSGNERCNQTNEIIVHVTWKIDLQPMA